MRSSFFYSEGAKTWLDAIALTARLGSEVVRHRTFRAGRLGAGHAAQVQRRVGIDDFRSGHDLGNGEGLAARNADGRGTHVVISNWKGKKNKAKLLAQKSYTTYFENL